MTARFLLPPLPPPPELLVSFEVGPVSVSRGAKRILLVLLCLPGALGRSFLSIPGVRSQIVEGEKRDRDWARRGREHKGCSYFEGQPRVPRPEAPHAAACVMALPGRYGPPCTY